MHFFLVKLHALKLFSIFSFSAPAKKLKVNLTLPLEVDQTTTMYS